MGRTYERITIRPEGARRSRTSFYEVLSEGPVFMLLRPVNSEGEDRSRYDADGTLVDVQELVEKALITKRLPARMNNHYGTLEVIR